MQNLHNLQDLPQEEVKKAQAQVAISVLCDADLRRRLLREKAIKADFTIEEALKATQTDRHIDNMERLTNAVLGR